MSSSSPTANDNPPSCFGSCPTHVQLQLFQATIFATPVIFASMLLLLLCLLYLRRRRVASIHSAMRGQSLAGLPPQGIGLSKSFRESLPVKSYSDKFSSTFQESQCAVCLGDYEANEKIKQLPACNHSFHVNCIDEWLAKNVTCPICRACLIQAEVDDQSTRTGVDQRRSVDGNRSWEGRVMNEARNQGGHRIESSLSGPRNVTESPGWPLGAGWPLGEVVVNIERS